MRCIRNRVYCIVGAVLAIGVLSCTALLSAEPHAEEPRATSSHVDGSTLDRGRYLLRIAGCNDCHTPGYQQSAGAVDESQWLTGDAIGWQGPWGVTYPPNLRLFVQNVTVAQWLQAARRPMRPPMPWFALRDMTDEDLAAIYHYIRSLGPAGAPAPTYLPPGESPRTPVNRVASE